MPKVDVPFITFLHVMHENNALYFSLSPYYGVAARQSAMRST